jgi:hypothetical protein
MLAIWPFCVFLFDRWNRRHAAVAPFTPQPAQKCAHHSSASRRSVLARRCSRDTAMRCVHDIGLNAPLSKPARQPKSVMPRFIGDHHAFDRMPGLKSLVTPSGSLVLVGFQLLQRLALDARTIPATSQLDWLISITTISVLAWFRVVKDRLRSFDCSMGRSIGLLDRAKSATPSPPAPYHLRVGIRGFKPTLPWKCCRRILTSSGSRCEDFVPYLRRLVEGFDGEVGALA